MATCRGVRVDLLPVTQWPGQALCLKPSPLRRAVAVKASTQLMSAVRLTVEEAEEEAEATGLADTAPVRLGMVAAAAAAAVGVRACLRVCACVLACVCVCDRASGIPRHLPVSFCHLGALWAITVGPIAAMVPIMVQVW